MKKFIVILLALVMVLSVFASCGDKQGATTPNKTTPKPSDPGQGGDNTVEVPEEEQINLDLDAIDYEGETEEPPVDELIGMLGDIVISLEQAAAQAHRLPCHRHPAQGASGFLTQGDGGGHRQPGFTPEQGGNRLPLHIFIRKQGHLQLLHRIQILVSFQYQLHRPCI